MSPEPRASAIGARLRAAREARGLSLEEVAARTRVPARHLAAIEEGAGDLPAAAYAAGFVRAYARLVGLDGGALARSYLGEAPAAPAPAPASAGGWVAEEWADEIADDEDGREFEARRARLRLWAAIALGAAGVLAIAVALLVLARGRAQPASVAIGIPAVVAMPPLASAPDGVRRATPKPSRAAAVAAPAGATLIEARRRVWLRVYEQDGRTLFSGILRPGQHYLVPASARDPRISTGLPSALALSRDGQALPPLPGPRLVIGAPLGPRDAATR